ncbi:MAG TPA: methyltransferase domain-containing protein [Caulobacteraceae bacterium]|nr:methyltransferase domain-containing protein [Caulobacteraceae bacterium]
MAYAYTVAADQSAPHLGGNIMEGDPQTYAPSVWDYTISRFGIESVLDLGSGVGNAAHYFFKRGLKVIAVDGFEHNIEHAIFPTVLHDLTKGPVRARVDLVHCQEVVEHIEEDYLEFLLDSLTAGRFILMTHALPGQGGHHHVNLQPPEYWIDHLGRRGCHVLPDDSNRIRKLANDDGAIYLAATGLLLANGRRL